MVPHASDCLQNLRILNMMIYDNDMFICIYIYIYITNIYIYIINIFIYIT